MKILSFGFRLTRFGTCWLGLSLGWLSIVDAQTATNRSLKESGSEPALESGATATRVQLEKQLRALQESLILTKAEADLFRQQWQELRLQNEALGLEALTVDEKKLQEKVVQAFKQAYQAERDRRAAAKLLQQVLTTSQALVKAGANVKADERANYEAARREAQDFLDGKRPGEIAVGADLKSGQIVHLNPELGVVIINVGRVQGVQTGMPFRVLQGDRVVGKVKAYQVREQVTAVLVETVEEGKQLKLGDRVSVATDK